MPESSYRCSTSTSEYDRANTPRPRLQIAASRVASTSYTTFSSGISPSCRKHPREVVVEPPFKERKRAEVVARRGVTTSADDNHRQAAFHSTGDLFTAEVDVSTCTERSLCCDRVEECLERRAATSRRPSSDTKGRRTYSEGNRGNSEGNRGNSEGARCKIEVDRRNVGHDRRQVGVHPDRSVR
jgi:hypothetical protein